MRRLLYDFSNTICKFSASMDIVCDFGIKSCFPVFLLRARDSYKYDKNGIWFFYVEPTGWFGARCDCRNSREKALLGSQADVAIFDFYDRICNFAGLGRLPIWHTHAQNCDRRGTAMRSLELCLCGLVGIVSVDWKWATEAARGARIYDFFWPD